MAVNQNPLKVLNLNELLKEVDFKNDNLHRIAISNVTDSTRVLARWWTKKYRTPLKHYGEYTNEELVIEMLEDYYDNNRTEIERFLEASTMEKLGEWDGSTSEEYEDQVRKRLSKFKKVDISKYQSEKDRELTNEEEETILNSLGRSLPKSKTIQNNRDVGKDEFEETFGEDL
jgi:hypothetical protein